MKKNNNRSRRLSPRQKQMIFRKFGIPAIVFILSVTIAIVLCGISSKAQTNDKELKYYKSVTVQAGDTIWDYANMYADEHYSSKKAYVKEVAEINNIDPNRITSGHNIIIPYYSENPL